MNVSVTIREDGDPSRTTRERPEIPIDDPHTAAVEAANLALARRAWPVALSAATLRRMPDNSQPTRAVYSWSGRVCGVALEVIVGTESRA